MSLYGKAVAGSVPERGFTHRPAWLAAGKNDPAIQLLAGGAGGAEDAGVPPPPPPPQPASAASHIAAQGSLLL
jgi:hypothetical protein